MPVPPFAAGRRPETSVVSTTAPKEGVVPPCKTWVVDPAGVWASTPDPFVYRGPPFDVKDEKVIVPEEVRPVSPVSVPAPIKLVPRAVRAGVPPGESTISPVVNP